MLRGPRVLERAGVRLSVRAAMTRQSSPPAGRGLRLRPSWAAIVCRRDSPSSQFVVRPDLPLHPDCARRLVAAVCERRRRRVSSSIYHASRRYLIGQPPHPVKPTCGVPLGCARTPRAAVRLCARVGALGASASLGRPRWHRRRCAALVRCRHLAAQIFASRRRGLPDHLRPLSHDATTERIIDARPS